MTDLKFSNPRCPKCGRPYDACSLHMCKDYTESASTEYLWFQLYKAAMDLRNNGVTWDQIKKTIEDWEWQQTSLEEISIKRKNFLTKFMNKFLKE